MCMADYNDDRPTIYRTRNCRTRKPRKCDECGRAVSVGEIYGNSFMVYEGHGSTFVTCAHCIIGQQWLADNCGGFLHGAVWEDLEEHIGEYPTIAFPLSRLKIARQRQWQRFDQTGLMSVPAIPPTLESRGLGD